MFTSLISTVEIIKLMLLFTWLIVDPPGFYVLFYVFFALSLLLDGVPGNTDDGTARAFHLGGVFTFPRIILKVTSFRIGLAGVVSALVSFRRDMLYALAWYSVGTSGGDSASEALIAA